MSSATYASLLCWLRSVQGRVLGKNVHEWTAASAHITGTGAITEQHVAFRHLQTMRGRNVGDKMIDESGNFVDFESPNPPQHRLQTHCGVVDSATGCRPSARLADEAGVHAQGATSISECIPQSFQWSTWNSAWEDEWLDLQYRMDVLPKWLLCAAFIILPAVYTYNASRHVAQLEDCWFEEGRLYRALGQLPSFGVGVGSLLLYCAIKMGWIPYEKQRHWYPIIVLAWQLSVFFAIVFFATMREITRALPGGVIPRPGKCAQTGHVRVTSRSSSLLNYSALSLPSRTCVDLDQLKTVTEWPFLNSLGCETLLLDCSFPRFLEVTFIMYFCRCSWKMTLLSVIIANLVLIVHCCAVGTYGWHVFCHCLLHLGVGSVIAYLSHVSTLESRIQFAEVKLVQQAAKQRRSFLHTLIPPNVLARLASHSTSNMGCLATDIPQCIIMFCYMSTRQEHANDTDAEDFRRLQSSMSSKDANDTDTEDFRQLHAVCLDFDDAVRMSGLYKYQHVGSWYIVTCPKAAAPFDVSTDSNSSNKATPQQRLPALQYATQMAELALRLMSVARLHSLELQVGIHTGPAAGAVIGSLRAFYCVYGPAVNTASRLCKFAKSGQICCSQGVVSALESEHAACKRDAGRGGTTRHRVRVDACGSVCMKGLERMDVFSIPAIPLRCSVYARRNSNSSESEQPGVIRRPSVVAESFNVDAFRMSHASVQKACRRESETSLASDVSLAEHQSMLESLDSQQNPFMALLKSQDLSAESLEILKESMPSNLESIKRAEEQYKKDIAQNLQRRVGAGIAMHLFGVIFQRNLILYPEFPYNFEGLNAELKEAFQSVAELLEQQLYLQCALCLGLALAIIKGPLLRMQIVSIMHGLVRLWWLHFSLHLSTIWPVKQYTLVFPVLYSTLQLLIIQDKDKYVYVCALLLHLAMYIIMLYPVRDMVAPVFILRLIATTISTVLLHIWHDKASQQRWRLHRVFENEMRRFEYILNDLLPSTIDQNASAEVSAGDHDIGYLKAKLVYDNFLHDSSLPLHLERDAIVLQLDLCSFTEFSRKISPMELAETLHQLFSRFDTTVRSLNLFKMDTVGDAYIVTAWLTSEKSSTALKATHEADSPRQNTEYMTHARKSCHSVLWLAGMMLNTLDSHRTKEGHQTTARIGVAVGKVVVGFLGWMQPRIHIRGYGMRKAEKLEQQGISGMVHVCDSFLNILSGGRISDNSTSPDTFMEDPPQHASFGEGTRKRREERSTSNMQGTNAPAPDLAPHSTQGSGGRTGGLDLLGPAGPHQQKISLSRLDLDLQGWSIVETRRNCQPEDDDDEPALGPGHNTNKGSGVVSTSFILQRPRTSDWE